MGEGLVRHTPRLIVKYASYFEVGFRKNAFHAWCSSYSDVEFSEGLCFIIESVFFSNQAAEFIFNVRKYD